MITAWALFFCGILCLMFIGMIYGDQFTMVSLFEGRWLEPIGRLVNAVSEELGEGLNQILLFVERHSSWVLATVSGTAGLFIVAFLMFSGMADDAAATHRDLIAPLQIGSVIDKVPEVATSPKLAETLLTPAVVDEDPANLVWQTRGAPYRVFLDPGYDRPVMVTRRRPEVLQNPFDLPDPEPEAEPQLRLSFERVSQRQTVFDDNTVSRTPGRLVVSQPDINFINTAIRQLNQDAWMQSIGRGIVRGGIYESSNEAFVRESTVQELANLERQVRVIPGQLLSESSLRVTKVAPVRSDSGSVDVAIRISNADKVAVSGLIVREYLPAGCQIRDINGRGLLRGRVITWLINDLRPFDEAVLEYTVSGDSAALSGGRSLNFEWVTEVSAVTAVKAQTDVVGQAPTRRIARRPELKMTIQEPVSPVTVGEVIEINFVVQNVGTAPAENVGLRVTLQDGLRHHVQRSDPNQREVVNGVQRLEPMQVRTLPLRMRATRSGEFVSDARMEFQGDTLLQETFRVVAKPTTDGTDDFPELR
ncbi:MAG: DUF11 domain-containing protein [Planctomycetaceae bacterium]|nr:DUF11 domain-containing protein [Planctomycetaceae bacterium]